ncbi:MAG: hypothetical protein K2N26_03705 [Oscillospiraceae bacterium]|nr:hypothetical protein [Oscillospiraceae bacterium]MDE7278812.1 hypothetical protein [Oscillospiraceae bacterium]
MLDYIGDVSEDDNSEDEDYYSYYDRETAYFASIIKAEIKQLEEMKI